VKNHQHPRYICLEPKSLELILLPLRQQVIDRVYLLVMICVVVDGDCLPCSVSYYIFVSCSESWTHVPTDHIGPVEDLHDCLVLFSSRTQNSLDSELWWSGDVDAVQQIPQSASGDQSFISDSLDLIGIMVHLLLLESLKGV
jgi:hypothetical protein